MPKECVNVLSLAIFLAGGMWLGQPVHGTDTVDRVVGSVNNSVITLFQLDQRVQDLSRILANPKSPTKGKVPPLPALRRRAVDDLIDEELILQRVKGEIRSEAAERFAERSVDEQIADLKKSLGEEEFASRLAKENQSLEEFRAALISDRKRQILVQQARQAWIDEFLLTPVSQTQVDKYIEEHPEAMESGGAPEVQFIFLKIPPDVKPGGEEAIRAKAERILAKARVGEPFDTLVKQYSQHDQSKARNGFLDLVSPTIPYPEFAPLFELDAGQIYPKVLHIEGWFCIARVKSKQSLYNVVRRKIATEEQTKALANLRKEATIIYDKELFPSGNN
jgi:hypothetical protein